MGDRPKNPELWEAHYAKQRARDSKRKPALNRPYKSHADARAEKQVRDAARKATAEALKAHFAATAIERRAAARVKHLEYAKANPAKFRAYATKRRAVLLKASPPWADAAHIAFIYTHCPTGYEVDHIIPLQGKGFGGLHVPANLQYLPASINAGKGNRCVDVSTHAMVPPKYP